MSTLLRRAFITVPPLVLAGVLLMHPNDEGDTIYESVRPIVDNWILVHIVLLLAFPFLILAAFMLLGGLTGRAAPVARHPARSRPRSRCTALQCLPDETEMCATHRHVILPLRDDPDPRPVGKLRGAALVHSVARDQRLVTGAALGNEFRRREELRRHAVGPGVIDSASQASPV
jgi:hypothetical protein